MNRIPQRQQLRLVREYLQAQEVLRAAQADVKQKKEHLLQLWDADRIPSVIGSPYAGNISFQTVEGSYTLDRELVKFFLMNSLFPHVEIEYPISPGNDYTICTHLTKAGYMKQGPDEDKVWTTPPSKFRK